MGRVHKETTTEHQNYDRQPTDGECIKCRKLLTCHNSYRSINLCGNTLLFSIGIVKIFFEQFECFQFFARTISNRLIRRYGGIKVNDVQIIAAIKKGDEAIINYTIDKYSKLLWSIAGTILKNVGNTEDIEECVADVFIYLWQKPEKFEAQRGKLKSYLAIVARSRATDKYRQLSKQNVISLDEELIIDTLEIADDVLSAETRRTLLSAIKSLEEPDREIIVRRYYYEQKPKEIAFSLDMPIKQVENHLYRTKQKLRKMIAY